MRLIHRLKSIQKIPASLETTWKFFSNPANLSAITPPFLNLKVTNEIKGEEVYAGQELTYLVRPLLHIPVSWKTEIIHVAPLKIFIDEQRKGPYSIWHHQHHFRNVEGGVEMTDLVYYRLPLSYAGVIAHPLVKRKIREIFTYRYHRINELFGQWKEDKMQLQID